jgi:hypothetical protein
MQVVGPPTVKMAGENDKGCDAAEALVWQKKNQI